MEFDAFSFVLFTGESAYRRAPGFFNTIATDTYIQTVFLVTNESIVSDFRAQLGFYDC